MRFERRLVDRSFVAGTKLAAVAVADCPAVVYRRRQSEGLAHPYRYLWVRLWIEVAMGSWAHHRWRLAAGQVLDFSPTLCLGRIPKVRLHLGQRVGRTSRRASLLVPLLGLPALRCGLSNRLWLGLALRLLTLLAKMAKHARARVSWLGAFFAAECLGWLLSESWRATLPVGLPAVKTEIAWFASVSAFLHDAGLLNFRSTFS